MKLNDLYDHLEGQQVVGIDATDCVVGSTDAEVARAPVAMTARSGGGTGGQTGELFDARTGDVIYQHRSPLNCAVEVTPAATAPWRSVLTPARCCSLIPTAVSLLDWFGVKAVRLLTNNPNKAGTRQRLAEYSISEAVIADTSWRCSKRCPRRMWMSSTCQV